jgi:EPS-associated MarR family transcriptional regulator
MKPEFFNILRKIDKDPEASQRELAKELGLSIGKLNYCLKALKEKGLIKIQNFSKSPKKTKYLYYLTPKGVLEKTKITVNFMKRKMREYEELKKELKKKK